MVLSKDRDKISLHCRGVKKDGSSQYRFELKSTFSLGSNVKFCFSTYTHFKDKQTEDISYKRVGSFVEVQSHKKLGKEWNFTISDIETKLKNLSSGPTGVFLILGDRTHLELQCSFSSDYQESDSKKKPPTYNHVENYIAVFPQPDSVRLYQGIAIFKDGFNLKNNKNAQAANRILKTVLKTDSMIGDGGAKVESITDQRIKGYTLKIDNGTINIVSRNPSFEFYAFLTLAQLWHFYDRHLPNMIIKDEAKYQWRGVLIDVARQFYTIDELKKLLDHFALFKINRLHLHLSDDEGWRIKSELYPQLNKIASFRGYQLPVKPQFGSGYSAYGGYYDKEDIKDLISYADKLHIKIMPELDFPGHSHALLKALPDLVEKEDKSVYRSVQEYSDNTLNPALSFTWDFLENSLSELSGMFNYEYIHVGFDERAENTWKKSPACKKLMADKNIKSTDELQTYFANKLAKIVKNLGKKPVFWEEASKGELDKGSLLIAWQNKEIALKMADKGYRVIASPAQYCYFDIREKAAFESIGAYWVDNLGLDETYSFSLPEHKNVEGIQGALWGETLADKRIVYKMLFPRLIALAEVAWSKEMRMNFNQFKDNLNEYLLKKDFLKLAPL